MSDHTKKVWVLKRPSDVFKSLFDTVQSQLYKISCMDDFLSGWLINMSHYICLQSIKHVMLQV